MPESATGNQATWGVASGAGPDQAASAWTWAHDLSGRVVTRLVVGDWLVTLWTHVNGDGVRQVREVDIAPATSIEGREPWKDLEDAAERRWRRWDGEPMPTSGLSAKFFRDIALGALIDQQQADIHANDLAFHHLAEIEGALVDAPELTRAEAAIRPYLRTAFAYARLVAAGDRRPAVTLAKNTGLSVRTVQDRVLKARRLGLLAPGQPGRPGGVLTPHAMDLAAQGRRAPVLTPERAERSPL